MGFMFDEKSQMVKDMLLLINRGLLEKDDVPDVKNLREVVFKCLEG